MKKIAALLAILFLVVSANSDISTAPKKAPGIALYDLNDNLVTLTSITSAGNVIIAFWASYCAPCKKEIPQLVELKKKYQVSKRIGLLLINIDKEGREKALPFIESLGITDTCLIDRYQVNAKKYIPKLKIPAVFLVNTKGFIVFKASGENTQNLANLEKAIQRL